MSFPPVRVPRIRRNLPRSPEVIAAQRAAARELRQTQRADERAAREVAASATGVVLTRDATVAGDFGDNTGDVVSAKPGRAGRGFDVHAPHVQAVYDAAEKARLG